MSDTALLLFFLALPAAAIALKCFRVAAFRAKWIGFGRDVSQAFGGMATSVAGGAVFGLIILSPLLVLVVLFVALLSVLS